MSFVNDDGYRSPAFFFLPSSTRLHVEVGDLDYAHNSGWPAGDMDVDIPLNVRTEVILECLGKNVKLTVGGKVQTATQPTHRYTGNLKVYASEPWSYGTAKAEMYYLTYETLTAARVNAGKTATLIMMKF